MASKKKKNISEQAKKVENEEIKVEKNESVEENEKETNTLIDDSTKIINTINENKELENEETKVIPVIKEEDEKEELTEKIEQPEEKDEIKEEQEKSEEVVEEVEEKNEKKEKNLVKKKEELPEYAKKLIKQQERKNKIIIYSVIIVLFIILLSTIFSLINSSKNTIVKGVTIDGINVSGLTKKEAREKILKKYELEYLQEIIIKYEDYTTTIKPIEIELRHNVNDVVDKAYEIGRKNNIILSNYEILLTAILSKDFEEDFEYDELALNELVSNIATKVPGIVVEPAYYKNETNELVITKGKDGITAKQEELKQLILNKMINVDHAKLVSGEKTEIIIPVVETKASDIDVEKIREEIFTEPQDAKLIRDPFELVPEVNGVDFAISIEEAEKIVKGEGEEFKIPLKITPAAKTIKDLGQEAFPDTLGSASTKYDSTNRDRTTNLQIAMNKINGTVLMPGEVFSYNGVVGPRTVANGFRNAKIYSNGEVVDGLGGGICQISSTLYNAVLYANLEIVERRNHSFTTSYLPGGKDATVVYGVQDFKFKNTREYPVKIQGSCKAGIASISIKGLKAETEYEVKIKPVVTATIPFKTEYIKDPSLDEGKEVIVQKGANGCKVTTYKQVLLNGEQVSYDAITYDTYNAMKKIVRVGTKAVSKPADVPVQNVVIDERTNIESD